MKALLQKKTSRRTLLRSVAVGGALVSTGLLVRAERQGVLGSDGGTAYEPWQSQPPERTDERLRLVADAVLAPSPHNTQPWFFELGPERVSIFADRRRSLNSMDPFAREMTIGLGAAIENLQLSADANGIVARPERSTPAKTAPELDAVLALGLAPGRRHRGEMYEAIRQRRTNRGPYQDAAVPGSLLDRLGQSGPAVHLAWLTETSAREAFGRLTVTATERIVRDSEMVSDSEAWFRHTPEEIEAHRDGATLDTAGLSPLMLALAKMAPRTSPQMAHDKWLTMTREVHTKSAPAVGLLVVQDPYDREVGLAAGRLFQRIHLSATIAGLALQPLNQIPELIDRERQQSGASPFARRVSDELGLGDRSVTFAFRLGWPLREASRSPRRALTDVCQPSHPHRSAQAG